MDNHGEPSTTDEAHADAVPDPVEFIWIFLPLPHPIGLPDKWTAQRQLDPLDMARRGIHYSVDLSVLIHQVERSANVVASDFIDITRAAFQAVAGDGAGADEPEDSGDLPPEIADGLRTTITLAEVALAWPHDSDHAVAIDLAVEAIRQLQIAVAAVTEGSVRLISRATLPLLIPVFRGAVFMGGQHPAFENYAPTLNEDASPIAHSVKPDDFSEQQLKDLNRALFRLSGRSPFRSYVDLRREAMVQRRVDGNGRLAVVCLAAGGEVFLDTLLQLMLWEERVEPSDAAVIFDRAKRHQHRVATQFPDRLKGDWDPKGAGAVADYFRNLVSVRHRVVHVGHNPTVDELDAAWHSLFELEHFVGDRLTAPGVFKRFPRTAMLFLGERGVRRRNRWAKWFERLVHDDREPNWAETFSRWRALLDLELEPDRRLPGAQIASIDTLLDVDAEGTARGLLHDSAAMAGAFVEPDVLFAGDVITRFLELAAMYYADGGTPPFRASIAFSGPVPPDLLWLPERDVFPEFDPFPGPRTWPDPGAETEGSANAQVDGG
jgi:hypothetical protein